MRELRVSSSFIQDQRHTTKSSRFQVITPASIAQTMTDHGLELVNLKTGSAKRVENKDHQITIARYRSKIDIGIEGVNLDIVARIPHLTGAAKFYVGLYRLVCSNGLIANVGNFRYLRVPHIGQDMPDRLNQGIFDLIAKHEDLNRSIRTLKSIELNETSKLNLAKRIVDNVLANSASTGLVQYNDVLKARRSFDEKNDAFTVLNVIQENLMRFGVRYQTERKINGTDQVKLINTKTRLVQENTQKSIDINELIWNETQNFVLSAA